MDPEGSQPVRDDSAWPRGAVPVSLLIGGAALVVGILVTASRQRVVRREHGRGFRWIPNAASGLVSGIMLANVGTIRIARAHRSSTPGEREPAEHRPSELNEPEPAPEPAMHVGSAGKEYLSFVLEPPAGLVLIGDRDSRDVPDWNEDAAISDGTSVLVSTRPPRVGPVRVEVGVEQVPRPEGMKSSPDDWSYRAGSSKRAATSSTTLRS